MRRLSAFFIYLQSLFRFSPGHFVLSCILSCANAFFSGVGLLLLIPLLHYAGWLSQSGAGDLLGTWIGKLPPLTSRLPLPLTLLFFLGLMVGVGGLQYVQMRVMTHLRQNYLFQLREDLNWAVAKAKWTFILECKLKQVEHMMTLGLSQIDMLGYHCIQMLSSSAVILVYLVLSLFIAFKLTLLVTLITGVAFVFLSRRRARFLGQAHYLIQRKMQEELGQFLEGMKLAKAHQHITDYLTHFTEINRELKETQEAIMMNQSLMQFLFLTLTVFIFVLVFWSALTVFQVSIWSLIALLLLFSRLLPRVINWQQSYLQVMNLAPVFVEAQKMSMAFQAAEEPLLAHPGLVLKKGISLDDVFYRYPSQSKNSLDNIHCVIPLNKTTAIVGPSGAGKTSLVDLLLGLLEPSEGGIYLDEQILDASVLCAWREMIGVVPQDAYFFHDSIRANLKKSASDAELWESLRQSAAFDFVQALPAQLDTIIGDRGLRLSGGERQRLALARALLRQPKVLFLDEATSALDHRNEAWINETLKALKGKITIILIAHRFRNHCDVDHVLVLNQGRIIEQGSPEALLHQKDSYFKVLCAAH